jgi:hypothetical protein
LVTSIAVDTNYLYWTDSWTEGSDPSTFVSTGVVMKVPLAGGTPVVLATGQSRPTAIAVDAVNVYWITQPGFATQDAGALQGVTLDGGPPVALATGGYPVGLAIDSTSGYWASNASGPPPGITALMSVSLSGGTPVVLTTASGTYGAGAVGGVAMGGANVYWGSPSNLVQVALDGGASTILLPGASGPEALAADPANVYAGASQSRLLCAQGIAFKLKHDT